MSVCDWDARVRRHSRLSRAGPLMLETLEGIVGLLSHGHPDDEAIHTACEEARAAISEATGKNVAK